MVPKSDKMEENLRAEAARNRVTQFSIFAIFISGALFALTLNLLLNQRSFQLSQLPDKRLLALHDDVSLIPLMFPPSTEETQEDSNNNKVIQSNSSPNQLSQVKNEAEALSSMRVAIEMKLDGKDEKALRLFKHAMALNPRHPEILTSYGEFLEHNHKDVIGADEMYHRALMVSPKHEAALVNRKRTAHIVERLDQKRLTRLDEKRNALSGIHETNAALRRAKKEAYIQHIYHSVGIEGNTMSLSETRSVLETRMAVEGKSIAEHNEIIGLDSALKFINESLVNK